MRSLLHHVGHGTRTRTNLWDLWSHGEALALPQDLRRKWKATVDRSRIQPHAAEGLRWLKPCKMPTKKGSQIALHGDADCQVICSCLSSQHCPPQEKRKIIRFTTSGSSAILNEVCSESSSSHMQDVFRSIEWGLSRKTLVAFPKPTRILKFLSFTVLFYRIHRSLRRAQELSNRN